MWSAGSNPKAKWNSIPERRAARVSCSPHKLRLAQPLKHVRVRLGTESFVSETKFRDMLEERYLQGYEAGQKALSEQLIEQRKQIIDIQTGLFRSIQAALPGVVVEC